MNYALDTPTKRNVYVPDTDTPFSPAYTPPNPTELDQTHRAMTWQFDNRQKVIGSNIEYPQSARLEKKK
jgi:hypothetical protein